MTSKQALARAITIDDLARLARKRLPSMIWDYLEGGAEQEWTMRANRDAFDRYTFRPRAVTGEGEQNLGIELFGHRIAAPVIVGPTGLNGIYFPDADLMMARACAKAGVGFVLSTGSSNSMEQVAAIPGNTLRMFQLYPWGDRKLSEHLVSRAAAAGYHALVVTVDSLTPGNRLRDRRNGFAHSVRFTPRAVLDGVTHPGWLLSTWLRRGMPRVENLAPLLPPGATAYDLADFTRKQRNPFYNWDDVAWLRRQWKGPFIVKGLLHPDDARKAAALGADAIVVSNHGGRALDGAPATLDVLPEMVDASGGMPVLVDSGFRRGSDVVKALALGAKCVLLGRAPLYGLAAGGEAGADRALAIVRGEIETVMALLGVGSVAALTRAHTATPARAAS